MPVAGERRSAQVGRGYKKGAFHEFASEFKDLAHSMLTESHVSLYEEPSKAMQIVSTNEAMKHFFIENSIDRNDQSVTTEEYEDHVQMMEEQYLNDREAVMEYAAMGGYNPVIGMTFPIHKNLLMNNIFDKGAIPKTVTKSPKWTQTMETRILVDTEGNEIDMFLEQNKMTAAIDATAPFKETIIDIPEAESVDVLALTFGANRRDDNLSIESYISEVLITAYCEAGDTCYNPTTKKEEAVTVAGDYPVWFKIGKKHFVPGYGDQEVRQMVENFSVVVKDNVSGTVGTKVLQAMISGFTKKNMFTIMCNSPLVTKVKLVCRIDTSSAMLRTCSTKWKMNTQIYEMPNANPINIPISPEEVKDVAALYQVNQLSKIMSMMKLTLGNYKDDKIHKFLDESFTDLPETSKIAKTYDFAPRDGYFADHIEWRHKTFMDALDTYVTYLIQVLNDPNMTVSIFGRPDLIRKITPTEYTYQTPSSIGPVELDFVKTVTTSDKRVYQFISSDKMRDNNNLIIILNPRNTDRIIYQIYDYQLYVSNEIRNVVNYALPAIHAFERWMITEYQPVQGRLKIINPTGLRTARENDDPIGTNAANDFTANVPTP